MPIAKMICRSMVQVFDSNISYSLIFQDVIFGQFFLMASFGTNKHEEGNVLGFVLSLSEADAQVS